MCLAGNTPVSPGPGSVIRNMLGWSQMEKTVGSGVWLFRGALKGENLFFFPFCSGRLGKKGIVPHSVGGHLGFLVFLLVALPTFATAQFKRFFDCGRGVRCMLPLGACRFMHLVALYGYPGADADAGQLASTGQLFDAALGELGVVVRGQPCMLVGDFNVEPTKVPCLARGISAGLWVDLEGAWALAAGLQPAPTCKRDWSATGGHRRTLWLVALLLLLLFFLVGFSLTGGLLFIFLLGLSLTVVGGLVGLLNWCSVLFSGLLLGCLMLMKAGGLCRLRFRGSGRSMMIVCNSCLGKMRSCWMSLCELMMFLVLG